MTTNQDPKILPGCYQLTNSPDAEIFIAYDGATYGFGPDSDGQYYSQGISISYSTGSQSQCQYILVPCKGVKIANILISSETPSSIVIKPIPPPPQEPACWVIDGMVEGQGSESCTFTIIPKGNQSSDDPQIIITPGGGPGGGG